MDFCGLSEEGVETDKKTAAEFHDYLTNGIEFLNHNLLHELPRDDMFNAIFCRNVTIYFSRSAQDVVHKLLCDRLLDDGILALGHSERLSGQDKTMVQIGRTAYIRHSSFDVSMFKKVKMQCL